MKRGAIFDMDGTLFDTEKLYWKGWVETADIFGLERKPELAAAMSGTGWEGMPARLKQFHPTLEDPMAYINHVVNSVRAQIEKKLEIKSGVQEILDYFYDNKLKISIASSSETATVKKNIKRVGWEKYFDEIVGGDQVKNSKPNPEIFLLAAEKIKIPATDCYVFEDSFNGIRAAHAAKCSAIMVVDCKEPDEEIRSLCDGVYNDMFEAMDAIKRGEI